MSKPARQLPPDDIPVPDVSQIVTEDDCPTDFFSAKQRCLLTEPLYSSWSGPGEGRVFMVSANVGLFPSIHRPPLVPDVFLSLDVEPAEDVWAKHNRSYFVWEFGKVPEVVIEVVSNREGNEAGSKLHEYARMGVPYYAVYDPQRLLNPESLRVFELRGGVYERRSGGSLPAVGLGLTLWNGVFEGCQGEWLRWCVEEGRVIPTGAERAEEERQRAEEERQRADRLAERLRALGIDPDLS